MPRDNIFEDNQQLPHDDDRSSGIIERPYLDAYEVSPSPPEIVPGRPRRAWMDETPQRFAYRCLPLTMANTTGWDILCPFKLNIEWNGGHAKEDLKVSSPYQKANVADFATSHFGSGIITIHTKYLFRTAPGWAIWAMGPPNMPKDGIAPLTGLVETDWLPFPFTMNWKMTRPGSVTFRKNEPICFITLQPHHSLEAISPTSRNIHDNSDLKDDFDAWRNSRHDFINRLNVLQPDAISEGWQRHYMRGETVQGKKADLHTHRRRLRGFEEPQ